MDQMPTSVHICFACMLFYPTMETNPTSNAPLSHSLFLSLIFSLYYISFPFQMWSPHGYDRAVELFERRFYDHSHFFRVVPKFLVQFGISYSKDEALQRLAKTPIPDDPPMEDVSFEEGTISYAGSGDNSRTSQLFISYAPSKALGTQKWVRTDWDEAYLRCWIALFHSSCAFLDVCSS